MWTECHAIYLDYLKITPHKVQETKEDIEETPRHLILRLELVNSGLTPWKLYDDDDEYFNWPM